MKRFERLSAEKLGEVVVWVALWKNESVSERRLMGGSGFGGFLNQLSKGLKLSWTVLPVLLLLGQEF